MLHVDCFWNMCIIHFYTAFNHSFCLLMKMSFFNDHTIMDLNIFLVHQTFESVIVLTRLKASAKCYFLLAICFECWLSEVGIDTSTCCYFFLLSIKYSFSRMIPVVLKRPVKPHTHFHTKLLGGDSGSDMNLLKPSLGLLSLLNKSAL